MRGLFSDVPAQYNACRTGSKRELARIHGVLVADGLLERIREARTSTRPITCGRGRRSIEQEGVFVNAAGCFERTSRFTIYTNQMACAQLLRLPYMRLQHPYLAEVP